MNTFRVECRSETVHCREAGGALVQAAIFFPVFLALVLLFWDLMMVGLSRARHQSAAIQIALQFKEPPLVASINNSGPIPQVEIAAISGNQLIGLAASPEEAPPGFLPLLNYLFDGIMDNAGTGASLVKHQQAVTLKLLPICDGGEPQCATLVPGAAYKPEITAGGFNFYIGPFGDDECINDNAVAVQSKFQEYVDSQLSQVFSSPPRPIGTKTIDSPATGEIQEIKAYLPFKPIIFWVSCSLPPRVFSKAPVLTFHTFFVDKELEYQSS